MRMQYQQQQLLQARKALVERDYKRKHPVELFEKLREEDIFDENFSKQTMKKLSPWGAFAFPFLKPSFCKLLDEELEHFEASGMPMSQPNNMHSVGLILSEIGLTPLVTMMRKRVTALCDELYPQFAGINGHHAFAVRYKADGNLTDNKELSLHYDESHVTLNVCLGRNFTGSKLFFCGLLDQPESHDENINFEHLPGS